MLENFVLTTSLDCWCGAEDEEIPSEQSISVDAVSQIRTSKAGPLTQKTHPCEKCVSVLKDMFHLTELQTTYSGHKPCFGGVSRGFWFSANLQQYQKHGSGEEIFKMNIDWTSFVTNCRYHMSGKPLTCGENGKDFLATSGLLLHQATPNGEKPHSNIDCEEAFNSRKSYDKWIECRKVFSNTNTVDHQRVCTREGLDECSKCGNAFSCKYKFVQHQPIHIREWPYKCGECVKLFTHETYLIQHCKVHSGAKPYECIECGRSFSWKSDLIQHQRVHTGERPYACSECGKSFSQSSGLLQHKKAHTRARLHECAECGKAFGCKSKLVGHQRIHTGARPYECAECGKFFRQSSSLVQHQRIHTGARPYECIECGKSFSKKS
uniref:C2H2-type domain-containing protein n=4 Tax=Equus TaxID=9789 RepID=F6S1G3_HORSE